MLSELFQERQVAIAAVEISLGQLGVGPEPLQPADLHPFDGSSGGWAIKWGCSDGIVRRLFILIDDGFPYTSPRIGVAEPLQPKLSWPHLGDDNLLCVLNSEATINSDDPAGVVYRVLKDAIKLIEDSIHKRNILDFQTEFLSYWILDQNWSGPVFKSAVELTALSRMVKVWYGKTFTLFADNEEQGARWLKHWGWKGWQYPPIKSMRRLKIKHPPSKPKFRDTLYCWLPEPLFPQDYPQNAHDLAVLLKRRSPESYQILRNLLAGGERRIDILFGTETQDGKCAFSVSLQSPFDGSHMPNSKKTDRIQKGFRPGKVPLDIVAARNFSNLVPVYRGKVERVDPSWIHGRDHNPDLPALRQCRVAIIGCGSLGSTVARTLAQAGIGKFLLIDPDYLKLENTSRHQLGASALKKNIFKTAALKANLEADFPHIIEVKEHRVALSLGQQPAWQDLESVDLIVSLTGNWAAENLLNRYQHISETFPSIIYGWMEPQATVGHALSIRPNRTSCLQCGFKPDGTLKLPVTDWPHENKYIQIPACADPFSPYGSTELLWSQALVSELALDVLLGRETSNTHRIWFGSRKALESKRGRWNPEWINKRWNPNNGWFINEFSWLRDSSCPVCTVSSKHVVT